MHLADGRPAIVKHLKLFDDVEDELRGIHYLRWRDGVGMVRLLAAEGRQMLLEYAGDRLLSDVLATEGDDAATEIAADVLASLLSSSETPPRRELQPLKERFAALFDKARTVLTSDVQNIYTEAATVAERLLAQPCAPKPLHGDLHHENIIFGSRGWLAIDPKGVIGNPAFDAANLFYNPLGRTDLCLDANRIGKMASTFARVVGQDERAILDHAFAYGCLSAAWHAQDGNVADEERELAIARAVRDVMLQS